MKITTLLREGKFIKSNYAYHATNLTHLQSILKHGLVPNKSEGGYGSHETSTMGYSLAPLHGVYMTASAKDALFIAKSIEGSSIVVVCKIQPRDVEMDEDRLSADIVDERHLAKELRIITKDAYTNDKEFDEAAQDKFAREYAQFIVEHKLSFLDHRLIGNAYAAVLNYIKALVYFYVDSEGGAFDDSGIKIHQEELTKKLRKFATDNIDKAGKTFKLPKPIGFSGANKIVGIYDVDNRIGWGDIGDYDGWQYHMVKSPQKLVAIDGKTS